MVIWKLSQKRRSKQLEHKGDGDWRKHYAGLVVDEINCERRPRKTCWGAVKKDMESVGLSHEEAQVQNWKKPELR